MRMQPLAKLYRSNHMSLFGVLPASFIYRNMVFSTNGHCRRTFLEIISCSTFLKSLFSLTSIFVCPYLKQLKLLLGSIFILLGQISRIQGNVLLLKVNVAEPIGVILSGSSLDFLLIFLYLTCQICFRRTSKFVYH